MKYFLLLIIPFTLKAQTSPPKVAQLVQLYVDTNTAAINDYAHQLGFTGEPFAYNAVGNTYDYMHYGFAAKDTAKKQHTYIGYTWGQHGIHIPYSLTEISYGTNSQAEFDTLVNEIRALGVTQEDYGKPLPGNYYYRYKNITIAATTNLVSNGTKYNISIGRGW